MSAYGGFASSIDEANKEAKRLLENVSREVQYSPQAIESCLANTNKCVVNIISAPLAAPVKAYIEWLHIQPEGWSHPFSNEFISLAQSYFSVDWRGITWADNIDTGNGISVSYCSRIFFSGTGSVTEEYICTPTVKDFCRRGCMLTHLLAYVANRAFFSLQFLDSG